MEVDTDTLLKEGKEFFTLRSEMKKTSCPETGTACYVVNKQWIERYKKYVFYTNLVNDSKPTPEEDHVAKNHPGKIDNIKILQDDAKFLKGTGQNKAYEADVFDTYLKEDVREGYDFEFCTEAMWQFINSRYGCDTAVKRFYQKAKYGYYSEVELRYKFIPVIICTSAKLASGHYTDSNFMINYVQISKRSNFSDLKKRLADCLVNAGEADATHEKIRLWSCQSKEKLLNSYKQIAAQSST